MQKTTRRAPPDSSTDTDSHSPANLSAMTTPTKRCFSQMKTQVDLEETFGCTYGLQIESSPGPSPFAGSCWARTPATSSGKRRAKCTGHFKRVQTKHPTGGNTGFVGAGSRYALCGSASRPQDQAVLSNGLGKTLL